jgi:hypothetical protein
MNPEQLLIRRYILIARYPECPYNVGDIFTFINKLAVGYSDWELPSGIRVVLHDIGQYPHIFQKLNWWEHREKSDLPEYVLWKDSSNGMVAKVKEWVKSDYYGWYCDLGVYGSMEFPSEQSLLPATQQQYNEYVEKSNS